VEKPTSDLRPPTSKLLTPGNAICVTDSGKITPTAASPDAFLAPRALLNDRVVVLDDDFDDGDIKTTARGIGAGFDAEAWRHPFNSISEHDGAARLHVTAQQKKLPGNRPRPVWMASRDSFPIDGATIRLRLRPDQTRTVVVGLLPEGNPDGGLELHIVSPDVAGGANQIVLTAWSRPGSPVEYLRSDFGSPVDTGLRGWSTDIEVTLSLTAEGYSVSLSDNPQSKAWSGRWSDRPGFDFAQFAGASGKARLQLTAEATRQFNSEMVVDRVTVTVPAEVGVTSIHNPQSTIHNP
jgi:hypothetical protein